MIKHLVQPTWKGDGVKTASYASQFQVSACEILKSKLI